MTEREARAKAAQRSRTTLYRGRELFVLQDTTYQDDPPTRAYYVATSADLVTWFHGIEPIAVYRDGKELLP